MIHYYLLPAVIASSILGGLLPSQAEAFRLKIEPSITFRESYDRTRVYPRREAPVVRRVYVEEPPRERVYIVEEPRYIREEYYYYAPEPHCCHTRHSGTDFQLKFKVR